MLTYSWRQKILFTLLNSCTGQVQTSKIPSYLTKFQSIKESMNFLVFFLIWILIYLQSICLNKQMVLHMKTGKCQNTRKYQILQHFSVLSIILATSSIYKKPTNRNIFIWIYLKIKLHVSKIVVYNIGTLTVVWNF